MNEKYQIVDVIDNTTGNRCLKFGYRIGRLCDVQEDWLIPGNPLIVEYPSKQAHFRTSPITKIEWTKEELVVVTNNRTYKFKCLRGTK